MIRFAFQSAEHRRSQVLRHRGGFSLVEVLLAVFILGIGVISVAAIFPAGISLQRQSNDDTLGPLVAQNAMAVLRSRLSQEDFGSFASFAPNATPYQTVRRDGTSIVLPQGDWPWMRPGFQFDDPATSGVDEGAIDIFSHEFTRDTNGFSSTTLSLATEIPGGWPSSSPQLWGIPYNPAKHQIADPSSAVGMEKDWLRAFPEPRVLVTQRERYWPMGSDFNGTATQRPQYVWDCMFRRFGGRVYVAVFVYRVSFGGGAQRFYAVAPASAALNAPYSPQLPRRSPLPIYYLPAASGAGAWIAAWIAQNPPADPSTIPLTSSGSLLDLTKPEFMWQVPGQWILDQNNSVHRVLAGRRNSVDGPVRLARPIPVVTPAPAYGVYPSTPPGFVDIEGVAQAWFMPITDANGVTITPVYVTVGEL